MTKDSERLLAEILRCVEKGHSTKETAEILGVNVCVVDCRLRRQRKTKMINGLFGWDVRQAAMNRLDT